MVEILDSFYTLQQLKKNSQQRLFRLRRRVQRAELQKEQKRQEQQRRREVQQRQQPRLWRRLVVMTATGANASGPTPPPPPPARGMGLAAVLMLSRARARSGGGVHDAGGQQYPQQQPQSTMGVQMQQQPRQRRQPYLPHIHNHYTLASSAARPAPTNTTATGGGGGGGGGGSGSSGRNNKASSLALLLAHAGRDAPPRSGKSGGGLVASTTGMSPLTVCVFASRRAAVASMLAGPQAAEFLASVDASGRRWVHCLQCVYVPDNRRSPLTDRLISNCIFQHITPIVRSGGPAAGARSAFSAACCGPVGTSGEPPTNSGIHFARHYHESHRFHPSIHHTPPKRLPDHRGLTPRDAARMAPYPRLCLELLKQAERVNLLHKVRRFASRPIDP